MSYRRNMSLITVTAPTVEPVSAAEVQDRAGVSGDAALIDSLIVGTRQKVETYLDRALITQTLRLSLNGFPYGATLGAAGTIDLPRAPLQSVVSVKYFDTNDAEQTFAASRYLVLTNYEPGKVQVDYGDVWPTSVRAENVVRIEYVAGYGDNPGNVPAAIHMAILFEVTSIYARRNPHVDSESIDNASRNYVNANTMMEASEGTGISPTALTMLQPFRIVSL